MEILLPASISEKLIKALERAGQIEIGGILMGEYLEPGRYKIADVTIQSNSGSFSTFIRNIKLALQSLKSFFSKTDNNYRRFNYLGEWHSHPSFRPVPSETDMYSMFEIIEDPSVGATFAVLMIIRLDGSKDLEGTATIFLPGKPAQRGLLVMEK